METRDEYIPPKALSTLFVSASDESSESKLELWREDTEVVLSSEDWSESGVKSQRQTVNSSLKLIPYINNSSWSFVILRREEQCPAHNRTNSHHETKELRLCRRVFYKFFQHRHDKRESNYKARSLRPSVSSVFWSHISRTVDHTYFALSRLVAEDSRKHGVKYGATQTHAAHLAFIHCG